MTSTIFHSWQRPVPNLADLYDWCAENCIGGYEFVLYRQDRPCIKPFGYEHSIRVGELFYAYFKEASDAVTFKLVWADKIA